MTRTKYALLLLCMNMLPPYILAKKECIKGASFLYKGSQSMTKSGYTCQRWNTSKPHEVKKTPQDGTNHNYCRNPDKDSRGTWCYTTDPNVSWEYCEIPKCNGDALAIWTSFDARENNSYFDYVKADPEYMSLNGESFTNGMFKNVYKSALMRCLGAGRNGEEIFFTDLRNNYFGIFNVKSFKTRQYLEGTARDIYAISQDWATGNYYWTDTKMNWVLVADRQFRAQLPVHKTAPKQPRAVAVHLDKRKLIFSTYLKLSSETRDTEIVITDLAGKNPRILIKYPDVVEVTGLAVDKDRIYWTDFVGYASKVVSCRWDGNDKIVHHTATGSVFQDLAIYEDYLYVTDSRKRYNYFDHIRYQLLLIDKTTNDELTYTRLHKPHAIAILYKAEEYQFRITDSPKKCLKRCGGVCLPDKKKGYRCHCSIGYLLQGKTGSCLSKVIKDNYLLVLDKDRGKAYQISLTTKTKDYSIGTLETTGRVASLTTDTGSGNVYLFDEKTSAIKKGTLNGNAKKVLRAPVAPSPKHMEVDPITKILFYVDVSNDITAMSADGSFSKIIVKNTDTSSDIRMIALEIKNNYIYWTNTYSKDGAGKVMRCKFDGSEVQSVLTNLTRPHGIAVDVAKNVLYVLDAKIATIYQIPVIRLRKIRSTSVHKYRKHELHQFVFSQRFSLTEMNVHDGYAYIVDEERRSLLKYNLGGGGKKELSHFGPSIFYRASSISVYSSGFRKKYLSKPPNPCKRKKCKTFCVPLTKKIGKCILK